MKLPNNRFKNLHKKVRVNKDTAKKLTALVGDEGGEKSVSFMHKATDTFLELFLIFVSVVVTGGLLYSLFEHQTVWKGLWWALVTAFTVGYGDVVPTTVAGRVLGVLLMSITVFVIIPLITARIAAKMIVNDDAWTDTEQNKLMDFVRRMNKKLDYEDQMKQTPGTDAPRKPRTVNGGKVKLKRVK